MGAEAVVEVAAEAAFLLAGGEVLVGGDDDAGLGLARLVGAQGQILPFLQQPQQLDLRGGGEVADLVEKEGAAGGRGRSSPRGRRRRR